MTQKIVVRFAPSPTGYLHIGGARTAIFNWLYAKQNNGKFILRIEDTDESRSTESSIQGILDGLTWLGITWDEGPYFQSRFVAEHVATAHKLLDSGHAYKCFCTKEALEEKRALAREQKTSLQYDGTCRHLTSQQVSEKESSGTPYTIRFKVPRDAGSIAMNDIVYGAIEKKHDDIEDFVIVRSNGQPLYVLSNTVDDIRDNVTHIIRGQDGLANTPKQILIYKALGAPLPQFAHMSLTLDPQKAKISKRKHGELVAIHFYKDRGFLPWALVNFLVLLGWATPDSRNYFSQTELIEAFSLEGISRTNSVFNVKKDDPKFFTDPKALNMNAHYLKSLPVEEIVPFVTDELKKADLWDPCFEDDRQEWFFKTIDIIRQRFHTTADFATLGQAYFSENFSIDSKILDKHILSKPDLEKWFPILAERIDALETYAPDTIEVVLRSLLSEMKVKPNVLVNAIRTALTGHTVGPEFFDVLMILGKSTVVNRLQRIFKQDLQKNL
jgi:glutamyl-tRNA synthetase